MALSRILPLTTLAATMSIAGCGGGGSDPVVAGQTAELSVSLMDAPVDGVTAVYVKITAMWIKPTDGPAIQLPLVNAPRTVNLLELTDTNAAILVDEAVIDAGSYEWLAMDIAAERGVRDSYVLTDAGGEVDAEPAELRVPSNRLRLVSGFDVAPNQALQLLFDWDMRKGLVFPPGQGQYLLKPAFRMLDVTEFGVLQGTIAGAVVGTSLDPAVNDCAKDDNLDLDIGNVVYVFAGADIDADDIDGTADPVATVEATRNTAGDYVYRTLLDPGTYTVTFTCQAGNDDPDTDQTGTVDEIEFLPEVNVANTGNASIVNFSLPPAAP